MNKDLELAQDKIIDKVGNICSRFGLNQKVLTNKIKLAVKSRVREVSDMIAEFNSALSSANGPLNREEKEIVKCYKERIKKVQEHNDFATGVLRFADRLL